MSLPRSACRPVVGYIGLGGTVQLLREAPLPGPGHGVGRGHRIRDECRGCAGRQAASNWPGTVGTTQQRREGDAVVRPVRVVGLAVRCEPPPPA